MPQTLIEVSDKILYCLTQNYNKSYALEELTRIIFPFSNSNLSVERENQTKVMDALIYLADNDLIILNSLTDESSIKIS